MDPARIAEHMAGQTTEELLAVVGARNGEFEPVAIELAKAELARRQVPLGGAGSKGAEHLGARCPAHPDEPALGTCARCGRFICFECREPTAAENRCRECAARDASSPQRIGGWLILSAIALFAPLLRFAFDALGLAVFLHANPGLRGQLDLRVSIWDLAMNAAMAGLAALVMPKFFGLRASAPRWMQIYFAFGFAVRVAELVVGASMGGPFAAGGLIWPLAVCAAWIAYFQRSERVKRTFVR